MSDEDLRRRGRALTPEQKRELIERLYAAWCRQPEQRLGQFVSNSLGIAGFGFFYAEDSELVEACESWCDSIDLVKT